MFKKRVAILFLLFASFVLLAHSFVPHHYHKSQVCIENDICEDHSDNHINENIPHQHRHEHDGENNTELCHLQQVDAIPGDRHNNTIHYFYIHGADLGNFLNTSTSIDLSAPLLCTIKFHSELSLFYAYQGESAVGLRAPPSV
ncbi:MAG: hypothetical protein ACERKD_06445 [Prolixibacteraceae bacterium]